MKKLIVLALALTATGPALAGDKDKKDAKDPDEIVCKSTFLVGSRIPTRVCNTRQRWDELAAEQREASRSNGVGSSSCSDSVRC